MKSNPVENLKRLNVAIVKGDIKTVKILCTHENVNNTINEQCFLPLHYASFYNMIEIASHILNVTGCNINKRCSDGSTPLFLAAVAGHERMVSFLLNNGAEVSPDLLNKFSETLEKNTLTSSKFCKIPKVLQNRPIHFHGLARGNK
jgi:ankyrin repeat protein